MTLHGMQGSHTPVHSEQDEIAEESNRVTPSTSSYLAVHTAINLDRKLSGQSSTSNGK